MLATQISRPLTLDLRPHKEKAPGVDIADLSTPQPFPPSDRRTNGTQVVSDAAATISMPHCGPALSAIANAETARVTTVHATTMPQPFAELAWPHEGDLQALRLELGATVTPADRLSGIVVTNRILSSQGGKELAA
jgi:hypothetical protein